MALMTSIKQQTSVEWLESRITVLIPNDIGSQLMYKNNINKAKEMDKDRMIQFAKQCLDKALDLDVRTAYSQVEQYYNNTYGKDKE
jgi:hypothetical protein